MKTAYLHKASWFAKTLSNLKSTFFFLPYSLIFQKNKLIREEDWKIITGY